MCSIERWSRIWTVPVRSSPGLWLADGLRWQTPCLALLRTALNDLASKCFKWFILASHVLGASENTCESIFMPFQYIFFFWDQLCPEHRWEGAGLSQAPIFLRQAYMKQALVHISIVHFFALIATQGRDTEDEKQKREKERCVLFWSSPCCCSAFKSERDTGCTRYWVSLIKRSWPYREGSRVKFSYFYNLVEYFNVF